ncbi:GDSL-type esterase/lipase family protein [Pseudorhodoferax sp.]|uniref:GDSL-type esterase/lipase family protein n=1 Tax=Pseudorhodoferax sp. TaxID=1993553 RepID=UPI002DD61E0B|nr:GDSL-type esterase/lipase family protein [Pseudorhodoferax sp.]
MHAKTDLDRRHGPWRNPAHLPRCGEFKPLSRIRAIARVLAAALAALLTSACGDGPSEVSDGQQAKRLTVLEERARHPMTNAVVLVGSSTLARWPNELEPNVVNLGLPGDTIPGLTRRLHAYPNLQQARQIVLNIGLNDMRKHCRIEAIDLSALLQALPSTVPVLWIGVQGVSPAVRAKWCDGGFGPLSVKLNMRLAQACTQRPGCRFVQHPIGENADDAMSTKWHSKDGVHLSSEGYLALHAAVRGAQSVPPRTPIRYEP